MSWDIQSLPWVGRGVFEASVNDLEHISDSILWCCRRYRVVCWGKKPASCSSECLMGQLCSSEKHPANEKLAKVREKLIQE